MRKALAALAGVSVLAAVGIADAAEVAKASSGGWDIGVSAGAIIPNNTRIRANGSNAGLSVSAAGDIEFSSGPAISLAGGYRFNNWFRAEAEFGYATFDYKNVSGNLTATYNGTTYTVSGSAPVTGSVSTFSGAGNLYITPMGYVGRVTPVLGGGVGFAATEDKVSKIGTLNVNSSTSNTNLMAQGIAGLDVKVTDNFDIGGRYRYIWVNSGNNLVDDFTAHVVSGTLTYRF
ncbi:outer membrane protein [Magnetospirillum sp. ME-1]|uniref:outer membrane protein n=1 Tax=Magnetospirillum sp. ME-1 TaxID=1639348 RepID=UPI00143DFA1B|nr:outer membrane beta-barrel protein [Magnetospirillum sp. ME-1]